MPESLSLTPQKELCLQLENVIFRLLINNSRKKSAESEQTPTKLYSTMHSHVSTELFACKSGEITINVPGEVIVLRAGDAAIIPPGIQHTVCHKSDDICSRTLSFLCHKKNTHCEVDVYKRISPFVIGRQVVVYRGITEIYDNIEKITVEATTEKLIPVLHAIELLIGISSLPSQHVDPSEDGTFSNASRADIQRMMKLDQIINVFFMRDLTLEEVAGYLFISPRQLDRIVKKRYGKTLRKVIIEKRLHTAKQMLLSTDMTTESIGEAVGFGSKPSFYREFSREYDITPSAFRKRNQIK